MGKRHIVSREEISNFNSALQMKHYIGKTLTTSEVFKFLKTLFGNSQLQREVAKQCFVKVERGKYFIPEEPIHIDKLQNCYNNKSTKKLLANELSINESSIHEAIKILKAKGYFIYKETLDIEKALKNPNSKVEQFIIKEYV